MNVHTHIRDIKFCLLNYQHILAKHSTKFLVYCQENSAENES